MRSEWLFEIVVKEWFGERLEPERQESKVAK